MVDIYVKLIKAGKKTIEQVPDNIREDVRKILETEMNMEVTE